MFRKPLIAILALLIASGTAFAKPRAIQPAVAISVDLNLSQKTKATRFRVSRAVTIRDPKLGVLADYRTSRTSRTIAAG
jgi:hypothetical protein